MATQPSMRRGHRGVAIVFTITVIANVVVAAVGGPEWVAYVAVAPLVVLMVTGWGLLWATSPRRRRRTT